MSSGARYADRTVPFNTSQIACPPRAKAGLRRLLEGLYRLKYRLQINGILTRHGGKRPVVFNGLL
jgi:hypothetical protein